VAHTGERDTGHHASDASNIPGLRFRPSLGSKRYRPSCFRRQRGKGSITFFFSVRPWEAKDAGHHASVASRAERSIPCFFFRQPAKSKRHRPSCLTVASKAKRSIPCFRSVVPPGKQKAISMRGANDFFCSRHQCLQQKTRFCLLTLTKLVSVQSALRRK